MFESDRGFKGQDADKRLALRQDLGAPLVAEMEIWVREQRAKLSHCHALARASDYML